MKYLHKDGTYMYTHFYHTVALYSYADTFPELRSTVGIAG